MKLFLENVPRRIDLMKCAKVRTPKRIAERVMPLLCKLKTTVWFEGAQSPWSLAPISTAATSQSLMQCTRDQGVRPRVQMNGPCEQVGARRHFSNDRHELQWSVIAPRCSRRGIHGHGLPRRSTMVRPDICNAQLMTNRIDRLSNGEEICHRDACAIGDALVPSPARHALHNLTTLVERRDSARVHCDAALARELSQNRRR